MKRSIFNYIKIYFMMISQDFKSKMAYRADFIISTIAMILVNLAGFASFWLMFRSIPAIKGFDFDELLFMYGFAVLAACPFQILFDNLWQLWVHAMQGDFIKYCFRPINLFFYYVAETLDAKGIGQLIYGLVIFIYAWIKIGIPVTFASIAILLISLVGASLVLIGIMTLASASAFITINGATFMVLFNDCREYAKYPTTIFNKFFRVIFTCVLPIGFISFYPSMYFIRPEQFSVISLISPVVGIVVFYIAYKLWMLGAVKYAGTGS